MNKTMMNIYKVMMGANSAKGVLSRMTKSVALISVLFLALGVKAQTTLFDTPFSTTYNGATLSMPYRIPALVETENATTGAKELIYFADKRHCGMDIGWGSSSALFGDYFRIDVVCRRSTNGGSTWGNETIVKQGTASCGYGDVAVVSDREDPKKIMFMAATGNVRYGNSTTSNPIRTTRFYSEDGGLTWSEGTDMTSAVYALVSGYRGLFFTSGRICQSSKIKVGTHYRLYSALCVYNGGTSNAFVVYSDDFGASWNLLGGGIAVSAGDESSIEELPNGNVVISSRISNNVYDDNGRRRFRVFKYNSLPTAANKASGSWESSTYSGIQYTGTKKGTNGELLIVPAVDANGNSCYVLLHSEPYGTYEAEGRGNVSIFWKKLSSDAITSAQEFSGTNWNRYSVSTTTSAYSTMILQHDGTISVAYEETIWGKGYSAPADSYSKEGWTELGYDLKYKNLSLATITNNAYSYRSTTQEPEATVTVATPTFNPAGGEVEEGTTVTISCATDGAVIYYTTNGSTPTTSSTKYTGAITVNSAVTIKAIATKSGCTDSAVASASYTIKAREVVATPTFNPAAGEVAAGTQVAISCATSGAAIYYTTNGSTPTTSSTLYTGAITVNSAMTIKAIAVKSGYYTNSAVATAAYTIKQSGGDESVTTVTKYRFKNVQVNGTVRYFAYDSTNGLTLTANVDDAHLYTRTTVDETAGKYNFQSEDGNYLVWKGSAEGYNNNQGYTESYNSTVCVLTVKNLTTSDCHECVSTGVPTGRGYVYIAGKRNDLTSDGVFIVSSSGYFDKTTKPYYTSSYSSAFIIEAVEVEVENGEEPEPEPAVQVASPSFSPAGGEVEEGTTVTISCETEGAVIYYTTDGSTPTTSSAVYSTPIAITSDVTINAMATKEGNYTASDVVTANFTVKVEDESVEFPTYVLECGESVCSYAAYATLYLDYAVRIPAGVNAYRAVLDAENAVLTLYRLSNGIIPANFAVIIENLDKTNSITLVKYNAETTALQNDLQGTLVDKEIDDVANYYVLGHTAKSHLGFFHPAQNMLAANKAYVEWNGNNGKALRVKRANETGIESVVDACENNVYYDIFGRRVENPTSGLYILNGKKVYIK